MRVLRYDSRENARGASFISPFVQANQPLDFSKACMRNWLAEILIFLLPLLVTMHSIVIECPLAVSQILQEVKFPNFSRREGQYSIICQKSLFFLLKAKEMLRHAVNFSLKQNSGASCQFFIL